MIFRFFLSGSAVSLLLACQGPASQSVESNLEPTPTKQGVPEVGESKAAKMEITADDVKQDDKNQTVTFTGNVAMQHPDFLLKCDRLLIYTHQGAVEPDVPFKQLIAIGRRVVVERNNNKGEKELGVARKLVYDPRSGDMILGGGPPSLQSGDTVIKTNSPDATIILKNDGSYTVKDKSAKSIPSMPKRSTLPRLVRSE